MPARTFQVTQQTNTADIYTRGLAGIRRKNTRLYHPLAETEHRSRPTRERRSSGYSESILRAPLRRIARYDVATAVDTASFSPAERQTGPACVRSGGTHANNAVYS